MNVGLIFGMIVAILIMGMVITFGYAQITNMLEIQERAEIERNIRVFSEAVERIYSMSGETSEEFTLTFPSGVSKVCFLPAYRGERIAYKKSRLARDLRSVIDSDTKTKYQLASSLLAMRISQVDATTEVDNNQTLLIFLKDTAIPLFEHIGHLAPTLKEDSEVLCVKPPKKVWLQRAFDSQGAWVDVEVS
jgi:hypothetical protein